MESIEYKRQVERKMSPEENHVNKVVDSVLSRVETPDYVIADNYSNVKIVLAHGVKYTMGNNGYVWHTNLRRWIPFYKVLFDI